MIVSSVENLCILAHSILLRLVLFACVLVSLTIVHVLHTGHFIRGLSLACARLPALFAIFLCPNGQPQFAI